jgi:2-polyprenyl-6-methoxyphenol hydroxylase-like FAD-dependent oxidoreductase
VGINLAIQDAVAAANILAPGLRRGPVGIDRLRAVQHRRMFPTRATQRLQILAQDRIVVPAITRGAAPIPELPLLLRVMNRFPVLTRIPARILGMGFRPEHVKIAAASP